MSNEALRRRALRRVGPSSVLRVIGANSSEHGFVASEFDRIAIESIAAARLPEPQRNYTIVVGRRRFIVDLAWPDCHFAIDLDGRAYHQDRFDEDRKRDVPPEPGGLGSAPLHLEARHRRTRWMIASISAALRSRGMRSA